MKIGIDISQVVYDGTGVGRFTKGLIEAILENDTENTWTFLLSTFRGRVDNELLKKITNSRHTYVRLPLPPPLLSFIWNSLHIIPVETFTGPLDVFICSDWTEPPSHCKKATIVHDFAYMRFPETVHPLILETQKKRMEWVKKESTFIITPSIATQKDVSAFFAIPSDKITSLYSGVTIDHPTPNVLEQVKKRFNLDRKFILSVGKLEPRKNIPRLIEAFTSLKNGDWELLIVGPKGWGDSESEKKYKNVHFTGYVSEIELHALYKLCGFFVYPSLWEGFGYPVLEAMSHGKSVAASDNSSLAELVEGRGLLFDPLSVPTITRSMQSLIEDQKTRLMYEKKGLEFAREFTWKRYYDGLMKVIS